MRSRSETPLVSSLHKEFPRIKRMYDSRFSHEIAMLMPGEYFVSQAPMIVYTVLGSCVSACIRDSRLGIGGMNHFMLHAPSNDGGSGSWQELARYGSYAMEMLINEIMKRGGRRDWLEVKVFGGGKIYNGKVDIGAGNAAWVMQYLKTEGLTPVQTDLGDVYPRKIYYFTETGLVIQKKIVHLKNRTIFEREEQYQTSLQKKRARDDVTLF